VLLKTLFFSTLVNNCRKNESQYISRSRSSNGKIVIFTIFTTDCCIDTPYRIFEIDKIWQLSRSCVSKSDIFNFTVFYTTRQLGDPGWNRGTVGYIYEYQTAQLNEIFLWTMTLKRDANCVKSIHAWNNQAKFILSLTETVTTEFWVMCDPSGCIVHFTDSNAVMYRNVITPFHCHRRHNFLLTSYTWA
jgi:hypothetical protein